jgi:hypothetical protein
MSEKEFFEKISLDVNGNVNIVIVPKVTPTEKGVNRYNTFKKIELTPEGYLKVYEG